MITARHSGHDFVDLDGNSHHISFRGIKERPTAESKSKGQGPEGLISYETMDGVKHSYRVSGNAANAVLSSFDRWNKNRLD